MIACFDTYEQWQAWHLAARATPYDDGVKQSGECVDCTPGFKGRMLLQGRCEHPETKFHILTDGVKGFRPRTLPLSARLLKLKPVSDWVMELLSQGPRQSEEVYLLGVELGFTPERVRLALKQVHAKRFRPHGNEFWYALPRRDPTDE